MQSVHEEGSHIALKHDSLYLNAIVAIYQMLPQYVFVSTHLNQPYNDCNG